MFGRSIVPMILEVRYNLQTQSPQPLISARRRAMKRRCVTGLQIRA